MHQINYLYFGGIFTLLVFIAAGSIFTKENLAGPQFFFFLYAVGQAILETALFIFIGNLIRRFVGQKCFLLFIGATFFILILHGLDFLMDRILDLSIWEAMRIFVIEESFEHFMILLDASGIPLWAWAVIFGLVAAIPVLGMVLYKTSQLIAQKKPVGLRPVFFVQAFLCVPCALFFWDFSASRIIHPDAYTAFVKSLPLKFTFFHPQHALLSLPAPLHAPLDEKSVAQAIEEDQTTLSKKPNIYFFVVESLRDDFITAEIAPNLHRFKENHLHFDWAVSNGNGTHISWFSAFHSQFPYHWYRMQQEWKMGSPALQLLKKWGYKVRLYSSAHLSYYGMEELLFGDKEHSILDSRQLFHHAPPVSAADTDAAALAQLQKDLTGDASLQEGQVFIIFWDCTHFDYCWPKNWTPKFTPFSKELAYFKTFPTKKTIEQIKNRYGNSVNYMDSLFGKFMAELPRKDEAVVIFMGDHGEEFFEHGHLFHNSHLTAEQTHIPLYFKLGDGKRPIASRILATQMDIFPTVIDFLKGSPVSFLEGNSLFQKTKWPFAITARFNAGRTPYEFCIQNGVNKLIARFPYRNQIHEGNQLHLRSLKTRNDKCIYTIDEEIDTWIQREFGVAFNRLFGAD